MCRIQPTNKHLHTPTFVNACPHSYACSVNRLLHSRTKVSELDPPALQGKRVADIRPRSTPYPPSRVASQRFDWDPLNEGYPWKNAAVRAAKIASLRQTTSKRAMWIEGMVSMNYN